MILWPISTVFGLLQNSGDNDFVCHLYTLSFLMFLTFVPQAFKDNTADLQGPANRPLCEQHKTHVVLRSLWSLHLFFYNEEKLIFTFASLWKCFVIFFGGFSLYL